MTYDAVMYIESGKYEQLQRLLELPDGTLDGDLPVYEKCIQLNHIPGGKQVLLQVIASTNPVSESCWSQCLLLDQDGSELDCTEVHETLDKTYELFYLNDSYNVDVRKLELQLSPSEVFNIVHQIFQLMDNGAYDNILDAMNELGIRSYDDMYELLELSRDAV